MIPTPRALVNPARRLDLVPPPRDDSPIEFHRRQPGYAPTPVRSLPLLASTLGLAAVLVKDESDRLGLPAFKVLGASWAIEQTLRRDPDARTLIAASAGNHGRAVARSAAQRGLACRIYLPAATAPAQVTAVKGEGAEVVLADGGYDAAVAIAAVAAAAPGAALIADVSDRPDAQSPRWVVDGYATLFHELDQPVDLLLVPAGVGSLAGAAVRWAAHVPPHPAVVAVEPVTAACITASLAAGAPVTVPTPGTTMAGLDCATPSAVTWPALRDGLAGALTVTDPEAAEAVRELAAAGLAIGISGAAPLAALHALVADPAAAPLREAVGLGPATRVLCLATEGPTSGEL